MATIPYHKELSQVTGGGQEVRDREKNGVGEEGAGSAIPKVAGSGRKGGRLRNIAQDFVIEKIKNAEVGANKYRAGDGNKGTGGLNPPAPLPPPTPPTSQGELVYQVFCDLNLWSVEPSHKLSSVS